MFEGFQLFFVLFVIVFILVVFITVYNVVKGRTPEQQQERSTVIKEREIIREIVKVRCPYCNNLYDEKEDKCPTCGGKRQ